MATTMDTQMPQHDDLNLMGLQELDSHLSLFESSIRRESSTPGAMSNSGYGDSIDAAEQSSHTIIVESPEDTYSRMNTSQGGSGARFSNPKSVFSNIIQYVTRSFLVTV
jgi:hypothetical protein